jgi:hypothetical protein
MIFLGSAWLGDYAGPLARARVGVRALAVDREPLAVPKPAVAAEVHQALDVHLNFAAKVAFDLDLVALEHVADRFDLGVGELFDLLGRIDAGLLANDLGVRFADSVDVRKRERDVLSAGKVDSCDACHLGAPSLVAACGGGFRRSRGQHPCGARSCTCHRFS